MTDPSPPPPPPPPPPMGPVPADDTSSVKPPGVGTSSGSLPSTLLQPILETSSAGPSAEEEDGVEGDADPSQRLASGTGAGIGNPDASYSPMLSVRAGIERTSSVSGAPTPNPVAAASSSLRPTRASSISTRQSSQAFYSSTGIASLPYEPPQPVPVSAASNTFFAEPPQQSQRLRRPSAGAPPYPLHHAPSKQVSFYADTTQRDGGPTGSGSTTDRTSTRARGRSLASTTARRESFIRRLSKGDEEGDFSDLKRCWLYCKSLPQRCFGGMNPLTRRVYQEALAPWQRRFSDVEDLEAHPHWWGQRGQQRGQDQQQQPQPPAPASPTASVTESPPGSGSGWRSRGMSVDDLRSSYVFGRLPSMALTEAVAAAAATGAGVDEEEAAASSAPGLADTGTVGTVGSVGSEVDLIRKEDFLMKLCVKLHSYGCPIPRTEYSMQLLLQALGVEGSFSVLPSMIFVSFGAPVSVHSETHLLRVGGGLDCYKLRRVNHLVNQILARRVASLPQAIAKLDAITEEADLYPWQVMLACYALSSGTVAPLFFKGSLLDGLLAGLLGLLAGALWVLADTSYLLGKVGLILTAFLVSFFATVLTEHIPGTCPLAVHFGPITYLLPGWSITCSVIELSTQNVLSGTARLMGSLMNSVLLGFGLDLGNRMAFWERPEDWVSTEHCHPVGPGAKAPLFLATVLCFAILLKAAPAQWPGMLVLSAISFGTVNLASAQGMDPASATVLTAFLIGVAGNLYSYATNSPALIPMLIAVFLIVPGGMSVKGVHALVNNDMTGGVVWSNVMVVAVSISIGLFAASVLMYKPQLKVSNTVFF